MITNISFSDCVFLAGAVKNFSDKKVGIEFTKYARNESCDVIVFDKDVETDGSEQYYTLTVKADDKTGKNIYHRIPFRFIKKQIKRYNLKFLLNLCAQ